MQHGKQSHVLGGDRKLARVNSCVKLMQEYNDALEKWCPSYQTDRAVERTISLYLCFDHMMPGKKDIPERKEEIERTFIMFEKIVHVQRPDNCLFEFSFLSSVEQPAEIIFSHKRTRVSEIRPAELLFRPEHLKVQNGKIMDPLNDVREAAKGTGFCKVVCKDMDMDTIVYSMKWNITDQALVLPDTVLDPSGKYGLTFAIKDTKGF